LTSIDTHYATPFSDLIVTHQFQRFSFDFVIKRVVNVLLLMESPLLTSIGMRQSALQQAAQSGKVNPVLSLLPLAY